MSGLRAPPLLKVGEVLPCEQQPEGSSLPRSPLNEAVGFECEDHLMHGRRAHAKISLHVGLRRRSAVDFGVVVNEREILALFVREGFRRHEGSVPVFSMHIRTAKALACAVYVRARVGHATRIRGRSNPSTFMSHLKNSLDMRWNQTRAPPTVHRLTNTLRAAAFRRKRGNCGVRVIPSSRLLSPHYNG